MAALCPSRHTLEQNCELSVQCLEVQGVVMATSPDWNKVAGAETKYYTSKDVQTAAIKLVLDGAQIVINLLRAVQNYEQY